jgi:iron complex transport system ATP-binding protein
VHAVVLEGVGVTVSGGRRILGPVDLRVGVGERWALLGPNGAGKTTLLSIAGAWRQPSVGRATVLGAELGRADVRVLRARIGHVSHTVADRLRRGLTVRQTVLSGRASTLETWGQAFDEAELGEADALLDQVGCSALAGRPLGSCSQGERQRVLLARGLFGRRELLILDEPAAGLDLPGREALIAAIDSAAGPTTLLATHHLEELAPSTTHAALMRDGSIVAAGTVDDVLVDEPLSRCFGIGVDVTRREGRWQAVARAPAHGPLGGTA